MSSPEQTPTGVNPSTSNPSPVTDIPPHAPPSEAVVDGVVGAVGRQDPSPQVIVDPELVGMQSVGDFASNHTDPGDTESNPSGVAPVPNTAGRDGDPDQPDYKKFGYILLWRGWEREWWWTKPWAINQLFLHFLMNANRTPRTTRYLLRVIQIERGCLATSYKALAERSGLSRKIITRMVRNLADAGEIEVLDKGQCGILLKLTNYETYTSPLPKRDTERRGDGTTMDRVISRHRHGGGTVEGQ